MRSQLSLAVVVSILCAAPLQADLIVNGSFELPVIPNGTQASPVTSLPGWTVLGRDIQIFNTNYHESGVINGMPYSDTFNAQAGNQSIDVSGVSNIPGNGVEQTVPTQVGKLYTLSFYVGKADVLDTGAGVVDLSINGGVPVPFANFNDTPNAMNWEHFLVQFTATNPNTTLAFTYGSTSPPNYVAGLDNVTLNAVPAPSTFIMSSIMLGTLAVAWACRRLRLQPAPSPCLS